MNAYEICEAAEVFITTSRAARIALSTCAPNNCFHYAHLFAQYPKMHGAKLQISFPVADDTLRRQLIPVASPSHEVAALASLWKKSMGPVELNCVLLDGVNDADSHARQLADFAKAFDLPVKINQYHDVELGYRQSRRRMSFVRTMWRHGIKPELYRTDGADVGAGCGQLRSAAIEP